MGFTDNLRDNLLDEVWGGSDYTPETDLYFGLSTTTPADDGTNVTEPTDAYARVSKTNNLTNFPAATSGSKSNGTDITFPEATGNWGTVTHFTVYTAATGGTLLAFGALTTSKTIESGDTAKFAIGDMTITLS